MNKSKLVDFINRYHLNGLIESVMIESKDNQLQLNLLNENRTLIGKVVERNIHLDTLDFCIYSTSAFLRMLSALDEEINISFLKMNNMIYSINISDKSSSLNYILSDSSVIPKAAKLKSDPSYEFKFKITDEFRAKFIKAKGSLQECNVFAIESDGQKAKIILNYQEQNSNRFIFEVLPEKTQIFEPTIFSADYLTAILSSHSSFESGCIEISVPKLMHVSFKGKECESDYFLLQYQQ